MEFKTRQLPNGLTIICEQNSNAQSAAVGFFTRTGSRDERPEINGVSHFLEHMMFKGTDRLSALAVNEAFDRTGAKFNAFTGEECTVYYAAVLPEMLGEVTQLWTELMRPALRDEDFNMEKNVIKEEIAMYKDLPQFDVMDQCKELHFEGHPCGYSVLGTVESIDGMMADQMRSYFENRYAPDNMILAFCGDLDFEVMCDLAGDRCNAWTPRQAGREIRYFPGSMQSKIETKDNLTCEHICMLSPCVSYQDDRKFAASLLATIIGDCTGSRYYWALVDTALAEVASMQLEAMDGVGVLYSYIRCAPQQGTRVREGLHNLLAQVKKDGITQDELEKARNKVLSILTIKCETPMGRLVNLGFNWMYCQEYRSVSDDVDAINSVTVDQVNQLAEEFDPSTFTQYVLTPVAKE